ncbi:hypothetical protein GOP47_0020195 [Adiantum capillus-veneris]|uniref:Uncharacterized protein n=1 Tax=Adiantum capillus-veneris TaxID=13818 RepID=A0A9D4Z979_ADICA|nr:hypothetical protein GOP47_0020195 [Adiantum capillus-veneris]
MAAVASIHVPSTCHDLDQLLDSFSEAATRSIVAAEAAAQAELLAATAAEEAAAAYLAAADAVGTPSFESLRDIAEKAERLLEALTLAAAHASQAYTDASAESMHASSAAYEAAILDDDDDDADEDEALKDEPSQAKDT